MAPTLAQEIATLAGGCFWCLEAVFKDLRGVEHVESGYTGGDAHEPSYQQVCAGVTGHAEAVQIVFDPSVVSFRELLGVFFTIHDPTTLNRQGADVGTQYRSVIFFNSPEQEQIAEEVIQELNASKIWNALIVTQLEPLKVYYKAEPYHQDYFENNPSQAYCQMVVAPKVVKFRQKYFDKLKT